MAAQADDALTVTHPPPPTLSNLNHTPPPPTTAHPAGAFSYPPHAYFPPFYTLQPNAATRASQLASWSALITSWAAHTRTFRLTPTHAIFASPATPSKRLPPDDARTVLEYMVARGRAEWTSPHRNTTSNNAAGEEGEVRLWWRSAEEWAAALGAWAARAGLRGTVLTLYELVDGPAGAGEAFHGLPVEMALAAARVLARRGKASVFGEGEGAGVKFYA